MNKHFVAATGIFGITVLDALAIWKGIDGVVMTASLTAIATIVGFVFGKSLAPNKKE